MATTRSSALWSVPSSAGDFPIIDYRIERSTNGVNFTFVELTPYRAATVSCPGERVTCWVRVRARNAAGLGPSSEANADYVGSTVGTHVGEYPPHRYVGRARVDRPGRRRRNAVFEYMGERTIDGGVTWVAIGSVQFVVPTCPVGISCGFRVSAVNAVGASAPSNVLTVGP